MKKGVTFKRPTAKEVALQITAHLKRFEDDPKINPLDPVHKTYRYWHAGAWASGGRVSVVYVTYQGATSLTLNEAIEYLGWLDAGNVGVHYSIH